MEGMVLKLKLQYFGHLMPRVDSLEKTLMLGGIGGRSKTEEMGLFLPLHTPFNYVSPFLYKVFP